MSNLLARMIVTAVLCGASLTATAQTPILVPETTPILVPETTPIFFPETTPIVIFESEPSLLERIIAYFNPILIFE